MSFHSRKRLLVAAAMIGVLAVFAAAFFVAPTGRSVVAGPDAGPAAGAPTPVGHEWIQVEGHGTGTGLWWLGTTDNQALELWVNNARALRLEPNATSPNLIGGVSFNSVTSGVKGATIGGGGANLFRNQVTDDYGVVGGGRINLAGNDADGTDDATFATVGGGQSNIASGAGATVGGGWSNRASANQATVGGGEGNTSTGGSATVAGGDFNTASGDQTTVGGGESNSAVGTYATVGGGYSNIASGGSEATVGGGNTNTASGGGATVGGGYHNTASGGSATVPGGEFNTADGEYATVPGGNNNTAGGDYSFAAGYRAKANNQGCFVWGDSTDADFTCNNNNRFQVRASGGVYLYTNSGLTSGAYLSAGSGSWSLVSDRNLKENFTPVDGQEVLASLAEIPITTWNYTTEDSSIRHMGPVAQDLYVAFALGDSDTSISTVDADGVSLAAIQGLYQLSQEQAARIQALEAENASLQEQLDGLDARVAALEGGAGVDGGSVGPLSASFTAGGLLLGGLVVGGLVVVQRRRAGGQR